MADVLRELGWQVDIWTCKRGEFQEEFNKKGYRVDFIDFENSQWLYKLKGYQVIRSELCLYQDIGEGRTTKWQRRK